MIKGVTHDSDGRIVQRLSVATKVAIGLPPDEKRNYPSKLNHFVFLKKKQAEKGVDWELDPELMKFFGEDCKEFPIVLIDDDIENIFPTCYAWWTATERKCFGDGESAVRRTERAPSGEPWTPCGKECLDMQEGRCKPSGDLRFVLADFPRLGSVCRIHTGSYRSVRQIHSALQEIQGFTGGRLSGLTAKLVVRPEEGTYFDQKDKKKKTTTIHALSLEVSGPDMRKLISNLTENAQVFIQARKLLGGHVLEVVEAEPEVSKEIEAEFYPEKSLPAGESDGGPSLTVAQREEIYQAAKRAGFTSKPEVNAWLLKQFGVKSPQEATALQYPKIMKAIADYKASGKPGPMASTNDRPANGHTTTAQTQTEAPQGNVAQGNGKPGIDPAKLSIVRQLRDKKGWGQVAPGGQTFFELLLQGSFGIRSENEITEAMLAPILNALVAGPMGTPPTPIALTPPAPEPPKPPAAQGNGGPHGIASNAQKGKVWQRARENKWAAKGGSDPNDPLHKYLEKTHNIDSVAKIKGADVDGIISDLEAGPQKFGFAPVQ